MNTIGRMFRVHIFGESHGELVGVQIDGCPAGLSITTDDLLSDIKRRKSGAKGTTPREEADQPSIVTGIFKEKTTGAPLTILFKNTNTRSKDYSNLVDVPRPGHSDFTGHVKFGGHNDYRGGGHFSGRLTLGLVAAGAIAKRILSNISIEAKLIEAGGNEDIQAAIDKAIEKNDSIGGLVECRVNGLPVGLGEPFFDSVESLLAHAAFSIPAIKGVEFGAGFKAPKMWGSEHNDNIVSQQGATETNHAGGINGGISNGNEIVFRVAVKPTSSTSQEQKTMNVKTGEMTDLVIVGRHDACIALRVPPVLEAATAIVLADLMMLENKIQRVFSE